MKAMLLQSDLHNQFWAKAAAMFVYVHNLLPRERLGGKSAWSVFTSADPPIPGFSFGEQVVFWTEPTKRSKLRPRATKGLFLGPGMAAVQTSFPGCHRVWNLDKKWLTIVSDVRSLQTRFTPGICSASLRDSSRPSTMCATLSATASRARHARAGSAHRSARTNPSLRPRREGCFGARAGSACPLPSA